MWSLAALDGLLFAGTTAGRVLAWDPAAGVCEGVLTGHASAVAALLAVGPRLVSGDRGGVAKVWSWSGEGGDGAAGAAAGWGCERTVEMEGGMVYALAAWGGRSVCCGMRDGRIRVWGLADGAREAELEGHTDRVFALAVAGDRLYSGSEDGTIRAWACGTWAGLGTAEAAERQAGSGGRPGQYPRSLAVSGGRLVSGSVRRYDDEDGDDEAEGRGVCEVRVWELETLGLQHVVAAGRVLQGSVVCLASVGREVWGGVGEEVVVWGRD